MTRNVDLKTYTYAHFAYEFQKCWLCPHEQNPYVWEGELQTHHIVRGSNRGRGAKDPATWFRACQTCHREKLDGMAIAKQLAFKKIHDPKHYDRGEVNRLRHRAPEAVTEAEVDAEVRLILESQA